MFEVGSHWHLSPQAIGRQSVRWLFATYERLQRQRYNEAKLRVFETEIAVERALMLILSKKGKRKLPPLPSYEEMVKGSHREQSPPQKPAWMLKYEEVNRERLCGGREPTPDEDNEQEITDEHR